MAGESRASTSAATDSTALREAAWELFVQRSPSGMRGPQAESLARQCFIDATAFANVAALAAKGDTFAAEPTKGGLDFAFAPNLKKTHPLNMVSAKHGNVSRVKEVLDYLQQNPTANEISAIPGVSDDLGWGRPEVNTARAIFPKYIATATKN